MKGTELEIAGTGGFKAESSVSGGKHSYQFSVRNGGRTIVSLLRSFWRRFLMSRKVPKERTNLKVEVRHVPVPDADLRLARAAQILLAVSQQKGREYRKKEKVGGKPSNEVSP